MDCSEYRGIDDLGLSRPGRDHGHTDDTAPSGCGRVYSYSGLYANGSQRLKRYSGATSPEVLVLRRAVVICVVGLIPNALGFRRLSDRSFGVRDVRGSVARTL